MKYSLFLIVVVAATASNALAEDVKEVTQSTTTETTGKLLPACKNKNSWRYTHNVRHETNPHLFYKCLGEYGFLQTCPTLQGVPLVFNEASLVCDWEGAFTDGSGNPDVTMTTPRPPPPPPNCSVEPNKKKPHPDCHKYYICENGTPQERSCPDGLNFDITVAECAYVNC